MSTETWTDTDNAHALGGAACTHQNRVCELERALRDIKTVLNLRRCGHGLEITLIDRALPEEPVK